MDDMSDDIVRFMNDNDITMATIGGHGFGAKVATATAINNMERFTGVVAFDGGPLDHRYYEAYNELKSYVEAASKIDLSSMDITEAGKALDEAIECPKWCSIFKQNLTEDKHPPQWKCNLAGLLKNTQKFMPEVAIWSESYGLWPGSTLALFPAYSRWVHLSTNTLQFYNVFPQLDGEFPGKINTHGDDQSPLNHWMHEGDENEAWHLSQKLWRWLKWHDGKHVLLADKSEAGWYYVPDRGFDYNTDTPHGEYTPEHVHHNYLHTDKYEKSREERGKAGASPGEFLTPGKFSDREGWY